LSPKKKTTGRSPIPSSPPRQPIPIRRGGYVRSSATEDAHRRYVTLAIIGVGVLIAFLILMVTVEQRSVAISPPQATAGTQSADASIATLQERLRQAPSDQDAMIALGNAYYDAKRYTDAIPLYEKALQTVPGNTDVRTDLGTAYYYSDNLDKAKEQWGKVLEQDPNKIQAHFNLGILYSGLTPPDNDSAAKEWQAVIKIDPNSEQAKTAQQRLKDMGR
jgi:cytochrome c-type biogenesis protein CcmH/NrfG